MIVAEAMYNATRAERFEKWQLNKSFPPSYSVQTAAEADWLSRADAFRAQYHEFYPRRAPLLLTPLNECHTRKMICTFIKPTLLPYEDLYDLPVCVRFLAGYLRFEPLEDSVRLPDIVVSPATTLEWQVGNCIELSLVTASALLGAGYNAFVVVGYARHFVFAHDYSHREWTDAEGLFNEADSDMDEAADVPLDAEYAALLRERPVLRGVKDSDAMASGEAQSPTSAARKDTIAPGSAAGRADEGRKSSGPPSGCVLPPLPHADTGMAEDINTNATGGTRLLHAWVLVLPGGRKCHKDAVYVEPSTGELIPPESADAFYTGIESIFNTRDVFVNLFPDAPVSAVTTDLHDKTRWEALVLNPDASDMDALDGALYDPATSHSVGCSTRPGEERPNLSVSLAGGAATTGGPAAMRRRAHGEFAMTVTAGLPAAGGSTVALARERSHGAATGAIGTIGTIGLNLQSQSQLLLSAHLDAVDVPARRSWVSDLTLSRAQYESRFPDSAKTIRYANAEVRWFAAYVTPDMRVMEVRLPDTKYRDRQQLHVLFAHRADKLRRRTLLPAAPDGEFTGLSGFSSNIDGGGWRIIKEWYEKGRMREAAVEGLRRFTHEFGVCRAMAFYHDARDDGLWRRDEIFFEGLALRKVKEWYRDRDDRLLYRSASFDRSATTAVGNHPRHSVGRNSGAQSAHSYAGGASNTATLSAAQSVTTIFNGHRVSSAAVSRTTPTIGGIGIGGGAPSPGDAIQRVDPVRVSEKYLRDPSVPADKDVAKLTFLRPIRANGAGQMWVFFHYRAGSVIRPHRMYAKAARGEEYLAAAMRSDNSPLITPQCASMALMPNAEPPTETEQYNERQRLLWHENTCLGKIRTRMQECHDILVSMREVDHPVAVLSAFDTLRNHPRETEAERARKMAEEATREESRRDYLAPYIARLELPRSFGGDYLSAFLTAEQARQVRDEALRDLKERLIERGRIMQGQMDKEKEDFSKKQTQYQSRQDAAGINAGHDEEEFAQYCKEATWRMKILDERLTKHIDQASEKYAKLAARLAEDPRLAALYKQAPSTQGG